jgi:lactonase
VLDVGDEIAYANQGDLIMTKSDRRTFLANLAQGSLAAALGFALPSIAWPVLAEAQSNSDQNPPIPPSEAALRQIKAEPWLRIDDRNIFLKGMAFDRKNNLTIMAAYPGIDPSKGLAGRVDRSILSISPDKQIATLIKQNKYRLVDHVIHKDGRIFLACLSGELLVANPDGSDLKPITSRVNGKPQSPSDLTFDARGNLYVTDFLGNVGKPLGGIYRWSPDFQSVELFGPNLVSPNGIAFSPNGKSLWVACSFDQKLVYIRLDEKGTKVKSADAVYSLTGTGGDGIRVDVAGNVYLAMNFMGRILVFDKNGKPVATVLMPGRDRGELLSTTNIEFLPGTNEVYAVAAGDTGGTWIYKFQGLAAGAPLYSHQ